MTRHQPVKCDDKVVMLVRWVDKNNNSSRLCDEFFFHRKKEEFMKLTLLDCTKKPSSNNKCIVEYSTQNKPMIISCEMKYKPALSIKNKVYDADVKLWSFCWWSDRNGTNFATQISSSCSPCSFIVSKIEEIVEIKLDVKRPYVKYKTTLADQAFEMKLNYPVQDEEDEPIKDVFKVGDTIAGLFKAQVKIKE